MSGLFTRDKKSNTDNEELGTILELVDLLTSVQRFLIMICFRGWL
jgi:hypothetical protein